MQLVKEIEGPNAGSEFGMGTNDGKGFQVTEGGTTNITHVHIVSILADREVMAVVSIVYSKNNNISSQSDAMPPFDPSN